MTTKIHAVVDALGNPIRIHLTAGNVADITPACDLTTGLKANWIIADRAYDADRFIAFAAKQGSEPVIPPKLMGTGNLPAALSKGLRFARFKGCLREHHGHWLLACHGLFGGAEGAVQYSADST